jgi:hypothetical protein
MNLFNKKPKAEKFLPKLGKLISVESFNINERHKLAGLLAQTLADNEFAVEHYRLNPPVITNQDIGARAAAVLYAVEIFHQTEAIRASLQTADVVVIEGYALANAGFCGTQFADKFERIEFFKWLDNLSHGILNIPRAHLNIILNPTLDEEDDQSLKESFKDLADLSPNTKSIEYSTEQASELEITNKIWELVRRIALKNSLPNQ